MNETIRNISIQKVKDRPNSYLYKLSLPSFVRDVLSINNNDRTVKIYEENGKIIIEKVNKI